jgi:hypothetical protein
MKPTVLGSSVVVFAAATAVQAGTLSFHLTTEFSGGQNPTSPGPWGRATFDDGGGTGNVTLTIQSLIAGDPSAFVTGWYFNLNPAMDVTQLIVTGGRGGSFSDSVSLATDGFQADGDGLYDIRFSFDNGPPTDRFDGNETVVYNLSMAGLTANSFGFFSTPAGGNGPFTHVGRIQGTGSDGSGSGWFTGSDPIPLPTGAAMGFVGLAGLAVRRRVRG